MNVIFWDATPCGSFKNRRFGRNYHTIIWIKRESVNWKQHADNVVPSPLIPVTLMMEAIRSSETSLHTRAAKRHISEGGILHSQSRKPQTLPV
jgi:hypothetical protein